MTHTRGTTLALITHRVWPDRIGSWAGLSRRSSEVDGSMSVRIAMLCSCVLVLLLVMTTGCSGDSEKSATPTVESPFRALYASVLKIQEQDFAPSVLLTGEIAPVRTVRVHAEVDGAIVRRVLVEAGQRIERGDRLLEVDERGLRLQLEQVGAENRQAKLDAERLQVELGRFERVSGIGGVSANELEAKRSEHRIAVERLQASQAARDLAARQLQLARFLAPASGLILTRNVEVGDRTGTSNDPYFILAADGELEFRAAAGTRQLQEIAPGMPALVTPGDGSAPMQGMVRAAARGVDQWDRRGAVRIQFQAPGQARSGVPATAKVFGKSRRAVVVPAAAVQFDPQPWVWVVNAQSQVLRRSLTLGAATEQGFEVLSGLRANETIVRDAGALLVEGDRIQPERIAEATPDSGRRIDAP